MNNVDICSKNIFDKEHFNILNKLIQKESIRQNKKFGKQKHTFEMWYMILMEEICEISQEFIKFKFNDINNYENVQKEIIEAITVMCQMFFGTKNINFKD